MSLGFSRQQYWSGFLGPPPGDLPDPGIEPMFPTWLADSLSLSHQGSQVCCSPWGCKELETIERLNKAGGGD